MRGASHRVLEAYSSCSGSFSTLLDLSVSCQLTQHVYGTARACAVTVRNCLRTRAAPVVVFWKLLDAVLYKPDVFSLATSRQTTRGRTHINMMPYQLSDDRTEQCTNCRLVITTNGGLCCRCLALPYCHKCHRHLPANAFDAIPGACQACSRKLIKRQRITRYAVDRIIAEVDLPTHQTDTSYERFITRNRDDILQVIDQHTRSHGYVNAFTCFARSSLHRQYTIITCPLNRCFVLCFSILLVSPQTMLSSIQS